MKMLQLSRPMIQLWIGAGCILLIVCTALFYRFYLKPRIEYPQIVSRVHYIAKMLEIYVEDHGFFPTNLQVITKEYNLEPEAFVSAGKEIVRYLPPRANAPDDTPVLVVTFGKRQIIVDKNFERKTID